MATRIALEQELAADPAHAFTVWRRRGFTERRVRLEAALDAELVDYADDANGLRLTIRGALPRQWMPAGIEATPEVIRTEHWQAEGSGYAGRMGMTVQGLPVQCTGTFGLQPWEQLTVLSLVVDLAVNLPFVGQNVERLIRDRMEPAFAAEFELLAAELNGAGNEDGAGDLAEGGAR